MTQNNKTTYTQLRKTLKTECDNFDELHEEAGESTQNQLTDEEALEIAQNKNLLQKSPSSYDSAHNTSLIDIIRNLIADELKRDLYDEVESQ